MLEPYSKARIINQTLNCRTKPFKIFGIMFWFPRLLVNILRWIFFLSLINNFNIKIIALCCFLVWPLMLLFTVSTKQIYSFCILDPNPYCKVIIVIFLHLLESLFEFPSHFLCYSNQNILRFTIFSYLFDENSLKIRDFIRFMTEFLVFMIIGLINMAVEDQMHTIMFYIILAIEFILTIVMAMLLRILYKSEEIKY